MQAVGEGVTDWKSGDRVVALLSGGGYAQYAVASSTLCLPAPVGLSATEAAGLPEAMFTVWNNVFYRSSLRVSFFFLFFNA